MNKLNPNALALWAFLAIVFHPLGWNWLLGLAIGLGLSLLGHILAELDK